MTKPRLLDLFCGAGGAAMGYHRAGFEVVGVDIMDQPRYPFTFFQADALGFLDSLLRDAGADKSGFPLGDFAVIHASPPCQGYTTMSNRYPKRKGEWPRLIEPIRDRLVAVGVPWVIENVEGAAGALRSPIRLHGAMFGLGVHRPRLFESNLLLLIPRAPRVKNAVGVYGKRPDGRRLNNRADGQVQRAAQGIKQAREAMGIDWMTWDEIREAIPPAYTEFIGAQLIRAVERVADVV